MIAYRAEIWCDGKTCSAGHGKGIPHDDYRVLPALAMNQQNILVKEGWTVEGGKHYCLACSKKRTGNGKK
jgi:hypothetical protein